MHSMLETNPFRLDLRSENASLQILPVMPIISSFKAGWNGAYLKHYSLPPHSMPEYSPLQHVIISHNYSSLFNVMRKLDGHQQRDCMVNGDVVVVPANVSHGASWGTEIGITVMILEPLHFARMGHDSIEPDNVELVPHFSKPDGLVSQIILALKTETETGAAGSNLYAESMITTLFAHFLRHYSTRSRSLPNYQDGLSKYRLKRAIEYIHEYIEEGFSLETLASVVGMSQFHFARMFKQSTGLTPHQYLVEQRLEKAKIDIEAICDMVRLNVESLFRMAYTVTRHFKKVGSGFLINTSSIAGLKTAPRYGAYNGTKYAVEAFTDALRMELAGTGIKVAAIAPGTVDTGLYDHWNPEDKSHITSGGALQPQDIARSVRFILEQPDHVLIPRMLVVPTNQPV